MSDDEIIEQLELENKVLQANNKGLKDTIDELRNKNAELRDELEVKNVELNEEKEKNACLMDNLNHSIRSSAIKERLGIEEDISEEQMLDYIDILVSENARLEDIEDKKVQIEYQNVFNKGVKLVEDKIKAKIEEAKKIIDEEDYFRYTERQYIKAENQLEILQELLEE